MAVYDGTPSVRLEGDIDRALALIPEAKALLYRVQAFKATAGVNTFAMTRRVGGDATIYVLSAGDQHILHIAAAPDVPEEIYIPTILPTGGEVTRRLDFYSGMVLGGALERRRFPGPNDPEVQVLDSFAPTTACRLHHDLSMGYQFTPRLAVEPWGAFSFELGNPNASPIKFSQYTRLRASMYSGSMAKVVQLLMGLGRLKLSTRDPDPYLRVVASSGVQIRYDWRFIRTHGIVTASDGKPWLVEISAARGVLARPLPVFPESTTEAFRAQALLKNDIDMLYVLDELGYLPTGEAFPASSGDLIRLIAAGDVIQLMGPDDLLPFYRCSPYSSSLGWSFHSTGMEAHNTAYYFDDEGFQRGVWYQIVFNIGATRTNRLPNQPVASGSAALRLHREGYIYCPPGPATSYARYVPIKFFEPQLGILMSHEGTPALSAYSKPAPYVDTPMFASFINDELHVVSYFRDNREYPGGVEDGRPDDGCMFDGEWSKVTTHSDRQISPAMYSNVFDPRELLPASEQNETWASEDRGWGEPGSTWFDRMHSTMGRSKIFAKSYSSVWIDQRTNVGAVAIPAYARDAYYIAYAESRRTGVDYLNTYWDFLEDAHRYYGTNDGHAFGLWSNSPDIVETYEVPGAPIDNPEGYLDFAVGREYRRNNACVLRHADDGPWFTLGNMFRVDMSPVYPGGSLQRFKPITTTTRAELRLYINGADEPFTLPVTFSQVDNHWMTPSPDPLTSMTQSIYAEYSALGAPASVYDEGLSSYPHETKAVGVFPAPVDDGQFPTFVGVNGP